MKDFIIGTDSDRQVCVGESHKGEFRLHFDDTDVSNHCYETGYDWEGTNVYLDENDENLLFNRLFKRRVLRAKKGTRLCASRADGGFCWMTDNWESLITVYGGDTHASIHQSVMDCPQKLRLLAEAALLAANEIEKNGKKKT